MLHSTHFYKWLHHGYKMVAQWRELISDWLHQWDTCTTGPQCAQLFDDTRIKDYRDVLRLLHH